MRDQAAFYEQPLLSNRSFSKTSSANFWLKRKSKNKNVLKIFCQKNQVSTFWKSNKKCSSKYNSYRSVINIAQNFGDNNLQIRIVSFPDQEKMPKEVDSGR